VKEMSHFQSNTPFRGGTKKTLLDPRRQSKTRLTHSKNFLEGPWYFHEKSKKNISKINMFGVVKTFERQDFFSRRITVQI